MSVTTRRSLLAALAAAAVLTSCLPARHAILDARAHFVDPAAMDVRALVPAPPAEDSGQERGELDELLALQAARTPAEVELAIGDQKTTVFRFAAALGLPPDAGPRALPALARLFDRVKNDQVAVTDRAKTGFERRRPFLVDPRIEPVVDRPVTTSYPSGHTTWGYMAAALLADMVPERRDALMARAAQYARSRMVGGVHFRSDVEAGRALGLALAARILESRRYRGEAAPAERELRAALDLGAKPLRRR